MELSVRRIRLENRRTRTPPIAHVRCCFASASFSPPPEYIIWNPLKITHKTHTPSAASIRKIDDAEKYANSIPVGVLESYEKLPAHNCCNSDGGSKICWTGVDGVVVPAANTRIKHPKYKPVPAMKAVILFFENIILV